MSVCARYKPEIHKKFWYEKVIERHNLVDNGIDGWILKGILRNE
jgi:hypothetical protein